MRILLLLICLLVIVAACWDALPRKNKIARQIMQETTCIIKDKYDLYLVSINESLELSGNYPYKKLGLVFQSDRKIERDEGRRMLLDIIQIFLDKINSNDKIQPYLFTRPFTEKNINVGIINSTIDVSTTSDNEIFSFSLRERGVSFNYQIPGTEFDTRHEFESLEEARRLASER